MTLQFFTLVVMPGLGLAIAATGYAVIVLTDRTAQVSVR